MSNRILNFLAFGILTLLWVAFAFALVFNRELLVSAWQTLRGWPLVLQIVVWLLTLPVAAGLWIWQFTWPLLLKLLVVAGLAWVTIYTFNPWKKAKEAKPAETAASASSKP